MKKSRNLMFLGAAVLVLLVIGAVVGMQSRADAPAAPAALVAAGSQYQRSSQPYYVAAAMAERATGAAQYQRSSQPYYVAADGTLLEQ